MSGAVQRGDLIADRYLLSEEIGGGRGVVFSASHVFLQREVAVKLLPSMGVRGAKKFAAEARLLGRLRHPNIVEVYDAGVHQPAGANDRVGYISMERLHGQTLKDRLSDTGRLTLPEITTLIQPVLEALSYLHARDIIHRDVKPSNVFLTDGSTGPLAPAVPKLLDFGLSSDLHGDPLSNRVAGTIRYLSPEQLNPNVTLDERVDIWAVGVMLYRMLTGRLPFQGGRHEVIMQIVARKPPPPSKWVTTIPRAIDELVLRALAKRPEERVQSAAELLRAWNRAVGERNWKSGTYQAKAARLSQRPELEDEATPLVF